MTTVTFFTTSYPSEAQEASGRFIAELAEEFSKQGRRPTVVRAPCMGWAEGGGPDALESGSGLSYLGSVVSAVGLVSAGLTRRGAVGTVNVGHWLVPGALAALAAGGRAVAYAHGGDVALLERLPLGRLYARHLDAHLDGLVFVSEDLRTRFETLLKTTPRCASVVLPMGVAAAAPDALGLGAKLAPKGRARRIVSVGRLVPLKGHETLVRALSGLSEVELCIAGEGAERRSLSELARTLGVILQLPGQLSPGERDALLETADLFVLPSRAIGSRVEGSPVALMEAMRSGLACIASRTGGVAEVARGSAVRMFPSGDVEALRLEVQALLSCPEGRAREGNLNAVHGRRFAWEVLGPEHVRFVFFGA